MHRMRIVGTRAAGAALLAAAAFLAVSCERRGTAESADGPCRVFASILPLAGIVERVGGTHVEVGVLVGPGQSPHSFDPTPRQVAALGRARALFVIGVPFEAGLVPRLRSAHPDLEIADARRGVTLRSMEEGAERHEEGEEGEEHGGEEADEHGHEGTDPHVWLDPVNLAVIVGNVAATLARLDPAHGDDFARNARALGRDLEALHQRIAALLKPLEGRDLFVFHPAFGYFADRYGLRQVAVEAGGKEPSARQLAALMERAQAAGAKVIFVQPQFSKTSAQAVAEGIGGAVVPLDSLDRDIIRSLESIAAAVEDGLSR